MTDFRFVTLHPEFPQKVWVIVEQPRNEPDRYSYDSVSKSFYRRAYQSIAYARGFSGVYGWIGGSGIPPEPHHKFIAVDDEISSAMVTADISSLQKISTMKCYGYIPE